MNSNMDIIFLLIGSIVTWYFSRRYYLKSQKSVPDWALPLIEKLPKEKPSLFNLLRLSQEALDDERMSIHPIAGVVACPECSTPSTDLTVKVFGDDIHTVAHVTCPRCLWSESYDL